MIGASFIYYYSFFLGVGGGGGMENLMLITEDNAKQRCPALDSHIACIDLAHWLHE